MNELVEAAIVLVALLGSTALGLIVIATSSQAMRDALAHLSQ
jgi:hypothetical protein